MRGDGAGSMAMTNRVAWAQAEKGSTPEARNNRVVMPMKQTDSAKRWEVAATTHVGLVRTGNEDAFGIRLEAGAFVVCDGMGGAAAGEVASRVAAEAFLDALGRSRDGGVQGAESTPGAARNAVRVAHEAVQSAASQDNARRGMGTTLVALLAESDAKHALIVHAGDSRCYRMRGGNLERMTLDHSFVEEQVRRGQLTQEEAERSPLRNVITRAVGSSPDPSEPDVDRVDIEKGDSYLLCSDGLTREVSDEKLGELMRAGANISATTASMVQAALDHGGRDNITCMIVRVL